MKKILIGVVVLVVVAAGGYFGASRWAQARAEQEVEAAFNDMRSTGMTASHGAISFDLLKRTLTVADVALETKTTPPMTTKVGRVIAAGLTPPSDGRVSADRVELTDLEVASALSATLPDAQLRYRVPRAEIVGYSGPASMRRKFDASSAVDVLRAWLEHLVAANASAVTVPQASVAFHMGAIGPSTAPTDVAVTYSGIALRDLRSGRIASSSVDRAEFTVAGGSPEFGNFSGEISKVAGADIDLGVILAVLDPAEAAKGSGYRSVYRQVTTGPYKGQFEKRVAFQIDALTIEGVKVQPSKFNANEIRTLIEAVKAAADKPTDLAPELLDRLASMYEGLGIDRLDVRGVAVSVPPNGDVKLAAIVLRNFENGRVGEYAVEGVDLRVPQKDPVKIGRAAMAGFNYVALIRVAKSAATKGQFNPEQAAELLRLLEGVSFNDVSIPLKQNGKPMVVDSFDVSWGQYVGPLPTKARVKMKFSGPIDPDSADEFVKFLIQSGVTSLAADFDMAAGWTEASRTFAVTPLSIELTDWFSANAAASVSNVTREIFVLDPVIATAQAMGVEIGPVEITVRDQGAIDRLLAKFAQDQRLSVDNARRALLIGMTQAAEPVVAAHPELGPVIDAAAKFLESPKGTLSIKVTPKRKVPVMELIIAAQTDPFVPLSSFKIDAVATK